MSAGGWSEKGWFQNPNIQIFSKHTGIFNLTRASRLVISFTLPDFLITEQAIRRNKPKTRQFAMDLLFGNEKENVYTSKNKKLWISQCMIQSN